MCYLVSYFKPTKSGELNLMQSTVFADEATARDAAEHQLSNGSTEVRLWKLVGTPTPRTVIDWQ